ncbi:tyrosine-type recombinase/integrase [Mycobacterium shinjukuense]|uniref:tyrosine-type recombinase/integrase n=1 Tax=Mycobacterium shinjukuense TaxID=398694 RepID=UPI001E4258CC|nr:tyrosine-type recombinase/integrase [Mycobacterium shinjukuense]
MTAHALRHTAASLAISSGANVKVVQRMLGHASAAMTLDVYADLFDDDLTAVAERLDCMKLWAKCGHGSRARPFSKHKKRRLTAHIAVQQWSLLSGLN